MTWSKTPPTESGWYWVKIRGGKETIGELGCAGVLSHWFIDGGWETAEAVVVDYLFGPAIPSPEQCAEIAKGGGA